MAPVCSCLHAWNHATICMHGTMQQSVCSKKARKASAMGSSAEEMLGTALAELDSCTPRKRQALLLPEDHRDFTEEDVNEPCKTVLRALSVLQLGQSLPAEALLCGTMNDHQRKMWGASNNNVACTLKRQSLCIWRKSMRAVPFPDTLATNKPTVMIRL